MAHDSGSQPVPPSAMLPGMYVVAKTGHAGCRHRGWNGNISTGDAERFNLVLGITCHAI